jgi:molybdopterin-dependent oxidoreductase alpha subunit
LHQPSALWNARLVKDHPPTGYRGAAAGWRAIGSSVVGTTRQMGLWRGTRTLFKVNQREGFDCPGCAWPEPADRSRLEFCENGAKAVADEATTRQVGPDFFARHSIADLWEQSDRWLNAQGRLVHPMLRREGAAHYEPIGWDEAFSLCAGELVALASPDEAIFYTSGRTSNEAAFLYQAWVRFLGTNNLPDCSNLCHESSGRALGQVIGVGKGTVQLEDFDQADLILVIGQNPGTNHPRMLTTLQKAARRGAEIIAINPLREPGLVRFKHPQEVLGLFGTGTPIASQYLQVRLNGDVALLKGLMKEVLDEEARRPGEVLDHGFLGQHTVGFEAFKEALDQVGWEEIEASAGLSRAEIARAAHSYLKAERVIACWAMGLTQHKNAVANIQEIVNLLLMRGQLGKPGAGVCPVRGHSNVQGDRTMGIWERPTEAFLSRLGSALGFDPPRHHGVDVVGALEAMHTRGGKVFVALGGNFYSATPDTGYSREALERCRLTVQVATKLNRGHLVTGRRALLLPCLGRTDRDLRGGVPQFVTVEDSMGLVHASQGHLDPPSPDLLSETQIICRLARAVLGPANPLPWEELEADYDRVRELIARAIDGFEDMNRRVREPGGFALGNPVRSRQLPTPSGKAHFTVHPIPRWELAPGELLLMTIRSHDQFNTTVYEENDRYRGVRGERRVIFMHPEDIAALGFVPGDRVDLVGESRDGRVRRAPGFKVVAYDIPRGSAAAYFPETNVLIPVTSYADHSRTPTSKSILIRLEGSSETAAKTR